MDELWKTALWGQLGAAIDTLENAIVACPDALWGDRSQKPEFWYVAYHTLFFLDYYASESPAGFAPPAPFTLSELDPEGAMPERVYSKEELRAYLEYCRQKTRDAILALTDERARRWCGFERREFGAYEHFLYSMRHVQHHAAQLTLLLREKTGSAPGWVSRARQEL